MTMFRLPDQVPVAWARIQQSGEAGRNAAHIDGSGLEVRNYLMHQELITAPASVSLQTRLRARLVGMTVGNPAFEGAAVRHRGFQITGTSPDLKADTQVFDSNPDAGGTSAWISGDTGTEFRTYNFVISIPRDVAIDYVTWELVVRSPGQIIVSSTECRHFYGRLLPISINGYQRIDTPGFQYEEVAEFNQAFRAVWATYLQTHPIEARVGQNLIFDTTGMMDGTAWQTTVSNPIQQPAKTTRGLLAKLRKTGTSNYDYITIYDNETDGDNYRPVIMAETRQQRSRADYDQIEILGFVDNHDLSTLTSSGPSFVSFQDLSVDFTISDFVAPSQ